MAVVASTSWARRLDRLALLFDVGSMHELPGIEQNANVAVVAATGTVDGRHVVGYAQDSALSGGSVGTAEAETMVRALRFAGATRSSVVGCFESAGARLQEGQSALGGFGRIFFENVALSGRVPQISVITGTSAGGGCYSPGLTDVIVMTRAATMFLTGPRVVHAALGEDLTARELGGGEVHERNGVCHLVADDDQAAIASARELLGYLPHRPGATKGPESAACGGDPGRHVPTNPRRVYDVRDVVEEIADDGSFLELCPRWARNVVTGFARVSGQGVGIVANQPRYLGGVLDVEASEKAARFVATCDAFGVPLVVLVDTPGFMPGRRQESAGIIRHGAQLVRAFAAATVPRLTVVLRKAYGGAYITMNSKDIGADLALAWKGAEIGVMGPQAAVRILHRRELAAAEDPTRKLERLADDYSTKHIHVQHALELGLLDEVIPPAETRSRLIAALSAGAR